MRNYYNLNRGDETCNNLRYHNNLLYRQKSQSERYNFENDNNYTYNIIQYDIDNEINNNLINKKRKKNRRKYNSFSDFEISSTNNRTSNNNLNNKMTYYNDEDEDLDIELEAVSRKIPINDYYNDINNENKNTFKVNNNMISPIKKKSKIHRNSSSDNLRINNRNNFKNNIIEYSKYSNNNLNNYQIRTNKNNNFYLSSNNYLKSKEIVLNNFNEFTNNFNDENCENREFHTSYINKNNDCKLNEEFDNDENCLLEYKRNFVNNAKSNISEFSFNEDKHNKHLNEGNTVIQKYKIENIELKKKNMEYLDKITNLQKLIKNENFLYQKIKKLENELTKKNSLITKLTYNKRMNIGIRKIRVCSFIISNKSLKSKKRTTSSIPKYNKKIRNFSFHQLFKNLKIIKESDISFLKICNNNKYNESIRENMTLNEDQYISKLNINDILNLDKTELTDNAIINNKNS